MKRFHWTPARALFGSFSTVIAAGAGLLMLPAMSTGRPLGFIDALFTATSAVCVTGLTVIDTPMQLTRLGQCLLVALIQIGGLGILTFATWILLLWGRGLGTFERSTTVSTLGSLQGVHLSSILASVFLWTASIEACGAVLLFLRWQGLVAQPGEAAFQAVFHSVSAFCNAGFSTWSGGMLRFASDPLVSVTLMGLVVSGGLGFVVLSDLARARLRRRRLTLHSRVVLRMTLFLLFGGMLFILIAEYNNLLAPLPWHGKLLASLFQSTTARTAGFNTLDIARLTSPVLFIIMLLMIVGASPGSTGGGIKTTSAAILLALVRSQAYSRSEVEISRRRLPSTDVARALATTAMYLLTLVVGVVALLIAQGTGRATATVHAHFMEIVFEAISALSTVGLSMDYTTQLTPASRLIVAGLMFCGRLGPIAVVLTFVGRARAARYVYPEESVMTG